jgi:hypothetical protein
LHVNISKSPILFKQNFELGPNFVIRIIAR